MKNEINYLIVFEFAGNNHFYSALIEMSRFNPRNVLVYVIEIRSFFEIKKKEKHGHETSSSNRCLNVIVLFCFSQNCRNRALSLALKDIVSRKNLNNFFTCERFYDSLLFYCLVLFFILSFFYRFFSWAFNYFITVFLYLLLVYCLSISTSYFPFNSLFSPTISFVFYFLRKTSIYFYFSVFTFFSVFRCNDFSFHPILFVNV